MLFETIIAASAALGGSVLYKKQKSTENLIQSLCNEHKDIYLGSKFALNKSDQVYISSSETGTHALGSFQDDGHQQQLQKPEVSLQVISAEEKILERHFTISIASLGLVMAGAIVNPILTLISIPGLIYLNWDFVKTGYYELIQERKIGIGVVDAIVGIAMISLRMFFANALFFVLFYLSQKLLSATRDHSKESLINIIGEQPRTVLIKREEFEIEIPFEELQVGDTVVVSAGQSIPIDGSVVDGLASVDQRMLTGESQPVEKIIGERVFAATTVISGEIYVHVEKAGIDTVAAQIGNILNHTADYKSSIESQGEVLANKSAIPMLAIGSATLVILGPTSALAVLLAYFGYNMRIIAPISVLNFLRIASQNSILIKDGRALELLNEVDTVVFDKTGTLTQDQPHVGNIHIFNKYSEDELLAFAAAAEEKQAHPIALAVRQAANERQLDLPEVDHTTYEVGFGIKVNIGGKTIRVGSARFMDLESIEMPSQVDTLQEVRHEEGISFVYIAIDDQLCGAIELHPTIRPEAKRVIDDLKARHMEIYIISGDHEKPTQYLAHSLGIEHYFAETLPENKAALISDLQKAGKSVCFVGDGINDSIALKTANVSISLRGASTIATDTAQTILMDESLNQLSCLFDLAAELDKNMRNNYITSVLPGVISIAGVYFLHFGVLSTSLLYFVGLGAGVANAMLPWFSRQEKKLGSTSGKKFVKSIEG